jgi:dihydroflavonol-4-reductase
MLFLQLNYKKMKILVTGPDGVLGSNLVRELLKRNHEVSVLIEQGKESITLKGLPIRFHTGNILQPNDIDKAFEGMDAVYHCAASTSVFPARNTLVNQVNIDGTKHVINACLKHSIKRLIYVGTANSFSFSDNKNNPGIENTPYLSKRYGLDYMDSKFEAQNLVLAACKEKQLPAIIVNPTFMIGPYDSRPSSGAMILAVHKRKIPGYTKGGKNYIAVKDVAFAMANALEMGRIGECYILGNYNLTYKEAFDLIADSIGSKAPRLALPNAMIKLYGNLTSRFAKWFRFQPQLTRELAIISCDKHYYSSEKAQRELQLPQTPLEIAVKDCFDWFKENGYLDKK